MSAFVVELNKYGKNVLILLPTFFPFKTSKTELFLGATIVFLQPRTS